MNPNLKKKKCLITMFDPVHVDTEWDTEDGHDRDVEPIPQHSSHVLFNTSLHILMVADFHL